jgi:hypothetical protein
VELGLLAFFDEGETMQMTATILMFLLAFPIQKIETQVPDRSKVTRVETAMNHLTVIELPEPVVLAAAGSPSFKIERRDNKVFIQPLEEGVSTNLFVWTSSGRSSYELVPAASVETMHFAVDQEMPPPEPDRTVVPPTDSTSLRPFAEEMLLFAKPIRMVGAFGGAPVAVFLTDVYRKDDRLFIRYRVDNRTPQPVVVPRPEVFQLQSPHSSISLYAYRYSQAGSVLEKKIHSRAEMRIPTLECDVPSEPLLPGEIAAGILVLETPAVGDREPAVFHFVFPTAGQPPMSLTLIL